MRTTSHETRGRFIKPASADACGSTASFLLLVLAALLVPGCGVFGSASRSAMLEDIREAVFRYQFKDEHGPDDTKVYFIAVEDGNPSPELLRRFADHKPPVKPRSACISSGRGVTDKQTGERGVIYSIGAIKINRMPDQEEGRGDRSGSGGNVVTCKDGHLVIRNFKLPEPAVVVHGGLFVNGLWGRWWKYDLIRRNGQWVVDSCELLMVS